MIYLINQFYGQGDHLKRELGTHLIEKGFSIKAITGNNGDMSLPLYEKYKNEEIVRVSTPLMKRTIWGRIRSYLSFVAGSLRHVASIEKGSTVVVTTQPFFVAFIVALFKKKRRMHMIYNVQDSYPEILHALGKTGEASFLSRAVRRIQRFTLGRADAIVAIGGSMKKRLIENYGLSPKKVVIIENWGKKDVETKSVQTLPIDDAIRILYTGNMGESHEIDTLGGTFRMLREQGLSESFKFRIIGKGRNFLRLQDLCSQHRVDFVEFVEPVPSDQLNAEYANADLSLVISHKNIEGILVPSKFYSVASSCPVVYIGSQSDTPSEHIKKGEFGYIIENGDSEGFFDILTDLHANRGKLSVLRKNAFSYYRRFLHSSHRLKEWEELLSRFEPKKAQKEISEAIQ